MVGIMQIMVYLICVNVVYKTIQMIQYAIGTDRNKLWLFIIAIGSLVVALVLCSYLVIEMENLVTKIGNQIPKF